MAYTELLKREDSASLWVKLRFGVWFALGAVLIPLLTTPITTVPLSVALLLVLMTLGLAAFSLRRGIKGAERLMYSLTPTTLTIERYRGAVEIPVAAIEYLRVVPLDDVNVPNSFPGYHVGKAKVPVLGKKVMVIASSLQGEGLLIGYCKAQGADIDEVIITPEWPAVIKSTLEASLAERRRRA
ncbi:MAG: hypothetical protein KGZ35_03350 [Truepera sp.]|nr:hypothetical protein [Truepera sp.]